MKVQGWEHSLADPTWGGSLGCEFQKFRFSNSEFQKVQISEIPLTLLPSTTQIQTHPNLLSILSHNLKIKVSIHQAQYWVPQNHPTLPPQFHSPIPLPTPFRGWTVLLETKDPQSQLLPIPDPIPVLSTMQAPCTSFRNKAALNSTQCACPEVKRLHPSPTSTVRFKGTGPCLNEFRTREREFPTWNRPPSQRGRGGCVGRSSGRGLSLDCPALRRIVCNTRASLGSLDLKAGAVCVTQVCSFFIASRWRCFLLPYAPLRCCFKSPSKWEKRVIK